MREVMRGAAGITSAAPVRADVPLPSRAPWTAGCGPSAGVPALSYNGPQDS
ncbi:hypothetical protein GCM10010421_54080 [Streptomyces glaucus]|uniref:Secreted protein n=1 Tax=Streptomyces glaucus TaxID=284029 RepID=A0ABN3KAM2_9ACTN